MCTFNKNFNTYMKDNFWSNPSFWKGKFEVTLPYEIQETLQIYSLVVCFAASSQRAPNLWLLTFLEMIIVFQRKLPNDSCIVWMCL